MKKRILGLLLALCMVICMLPMNAFAALDTTPAKFLYYPESGQGAAVTVIEGGNAKYLYTDGGYVVSQKNGVSVGESDYNIKFAYPEGGKPTVYLKGAVISHDKGYGLQIGPDSGETRDYNIVIESESSITASKAYTAAIFAQTTGKATVTSVNNAELTLTGNGTAYAYRSSGTTEFNNANVYATTSNVSTQAVWIKGDLAVDGGQFTAQAAASAIVLDGSTSDIYVRNNGTLTAHTSNAYQGAVRTNGALVVYYANVNVSGLGDRPAFSNANMDVFLQGSTLVEGTAPNSYTYKVVHTHTSGADDHDCTTAERCACGFGGAANTAHTPAADDGDCTTAIMCANPGCEQVAVAGNASHAPEADDGDCTTAVACTNPGCTTPAVAAKAHEPEDGQFTCSQAIPCKNCDQNYSEAGSHFGGTATCEDLAICEGCGQPWGTLASCTPNADDGDCTTPITCSVCGDETTPANASHTPAADDGDCTTAIVCSVCGTETTPANASHTPAADDGDCLTAVNCVNCDQVAVEAEAAHVDTDGDEFCNNAGCTQAMPVVPDRVAIRYYNSAAGVVKAVQNNGEALYFYTVNGEIVTNNGTSDASESDYNIKFVYNAGGKPTIYLKGAVINNDNGYPLEIGVKIAAEDPVEDSDFVVIIESESSIATSKQYRSVVYSQTTGKVTFTSVDNAKLTLTGNGENYAYRGSGELEFANANVEMVATNNSYVAIWNAGDLIVDGGNVTVQSGHTAIWLSFTATDAGVNGVYNITVKNNGSLTAQTTYQYAGTVRFGGTLTVQNANVNFGGAARPAFAANTDRTLFVIEGCNVVTDTENTYEVAHTHAAAADDHDCTTGETCACGYEMTTGEAAHIADDDDGDCTTDILCANPGCTQVVTPGAAAHTPEADDDNCATAVKCTNPGCEADVVPAKAHEPVDGNYTCADTIPCKNCSQNYSEAGNHYGGTATCQEKAKCESCGQEYGELGSCTAEADDGDCTTDVMCANDGCTLVVIPGNASHTPEADDGDCTTDILCANDGCNQVVTPGNAQHTPAADDGDCTTAVLCSVCGKVAVEAKADHTDANGDGICDSTGCISGSTPLEARIRYYSAGDTGPVAETKRVFNNGQALYFYTVDGCVVTNNGTSDASESDYNIKFVFPAGGTPTVYLKGAVINNNLGYGLELGCKARPTDAAITTDFNVVIESESSINASLQFRSAIYSQTTGKVTISSVDNAKLTLTAASGYPYRGSGHTEFKDANVELNIADQYSAGILNVGDLTINGGEVAINAGYSSIVLSTSATDVAGGPFNLVVKNNAKLTVRSTHTWQPAVRLGGTITVNRATMDLGLGRKCLADTTEVIIMGNCTEEGDRVGGSYIVTYVPVEGDNCTNGHTPAADDGDCTTAIKCTVCDEVITEGNAAHAPAADDGDCTTAVKCTNPGCTADAVAAKAHEPVDGEFTCADTIPCKNCDKNYSEAGNHYGGTATCQEKAKCASCGKEYGELGACTPEADDGDCTTAIKCSVCGEVVTAGNAAHDFGADGICKNEGCTEEFEVLEARIRYYNANSMGETKRVFNNGEALYFYTVDGVVVAEKDGTAASEDDYNIKFVFPANGKPTVYLKGAVIDNGLGYGLELGCKAAPTDPAITTDFDVVVESESSINVTGQYRSAIYSQTTGKVTISSVDNAKLTLTAASNYPYRGSGHTEFKKANVELNIADQYSAGIFNVGDLTINGGEVTINAGFSSILLSTSASSVAGDTPFNLVVKNKAKLTVRTTYTWQPAVRLGGTITVNRATMDLGLGRKCLADTTEVIIIGNCTEVGNPGGGSYVITYVPSDDDIDCEEVGHTPAEDDGDCTTAIICTVCEEILTPAMDAHTPGEDDDDCTTAVKCTNPGCTADAVAAKEHEAVDGDYECYEAVACKNCSKNAREAGEHFGGTATCKEKAKCASCGEEYGELGVHTPAEDDGDCTTAVKCNACGEVAIEAKDAHAYTDNKDKTCDNEGCKHTRDIVDDSNPAGGDEAVLVPMFILLAVSLCGLAISLNKKRIIK